MTLIEKLAAWREDAASFHGDRQLADAVLIGCGWLCDPNPSFEGGVEWYFGTNPRYSSGETHRPHPIQSLDAAMGQLPPDWRIWSMQQIHRDTFWRVEGASFDHVSIARHADLRLAVCMVAVQAWGLLR